MPVSRRGNMMVVDGLAETVGKLKRLNVLARQSVRDAVLDSVLALDRLAKTPDPNSGDPTAWVDGVPVDEGRLLSSQRWVLYQGGLAAEYGTDVEYALAVHDGTSKMPPRPWLEDSFNRIVPEHVKNIRLAAGWAVKKVSV